MTTKQENKSLERAAVLTSAVCDDLSAMQGGTMTGAKAASFCRLSPNNFTGWILARKIDAVGINLYKTSDILALDEYLNAQFND